MVSGLRQGVQYLQYRQIACFRIMSHNVSAAISYKYPDYKRQQSHQLPIIPLTVYYASLWVQLRILSVL